MLTAANRNADLWISFAEPIGATHGSRVGDDGRSITVDRDQTDVDMTSSHVSDPNGLVCSVDMDDLH